MSKLKIGDKVIVRERVTQWVYQGGAKGKIISKLIPLFREMLLVEFYEGQYIVGNNNGVWLVPSTDVKSLEKGKARPPKKPITSITKKYKVKYKNIVTGIRYLDIIEVFSLKDTERVLMELRRKGVKSIDKKFFIKIYKAEEAFKPIYLLIRSDGIVAWRHIKDGSWIYKRVC